MRQYEIAEHKLNIYKRYTIGILVVSVVTQIALGIAMDIWNHGVFWGTTIFLCVAFSLGYEGYAKYLREFSFVSCKGCIKCRHKRDRGIAFYYCSLHSGKQYIDPEAKRLCNDYEKIPEWLQKAQWEEDEWGSVS